MYYRIYVSLACSSHSISLFPITMERVTGPSDPDSSRVVEAGECDTTPKPHPWRSKMGYETVEAFPL